MLEIPQCEGAILMGHPIVEYRNTLLWAVH